MSKSSSSNGGMVTLIKDKRLWGTNMIGYVSPLSDQAYLQAAAIFQRLRPEKPVTRQLLLYGMKTDTRLPESRDRTAERQAYQLAFSTLRYKDLLEDIMMDSCFHTSQLINSDLLPLAMVMLFDFQDRRFVQRERSTKEEEERHQEVIDLEGRLHRCKTKLAASLARCRVKQNLQSLSCFLSDSVRTKQNQTKLLPLYAWVNLLKTSKSTFCRDPLCSDTLVFSQNLPMVLKSSSITASHSLNIQDRSVCVAVNVLRPLLFDNGDVLVAGSFSAGTVAHIAVTAAACSGRVLMCGADHTPLQVEEIQEQLAQMDIKNVRILSEAFCGLNERDNSAQRLKVIIVLPQCSSSALSDPVPIIHSEHGDVDLLEHLSHGSVSQSKLCELTTQQTRLLAHAVTFPKVQTVVYCTRSEYPEENEQLVKGVLEKTHTPSKLLPFRVNGPIFPDDTHSGDTTDSKFFRLQSSRFTNGCFVARLSRQPDPTKVESVQDVLARAAAKGLLGGIILEPSNPGKRGKSKKDHMVSSPSTGTGNDPVHSDHEGDKSEGGVEEGKEENKGGNRLRKIKGLKGRKLKIKRRAKRTQTAFKRHPRGQEKTPTKKRHPHHRSRPIKSKARRIPHLTLTLISSIKPSSHTPPIAALTASATAASTGGPPSPAGPAPPPPHTSSKQVLRQNTQPEKAEKDKVEPGRHREEVGRRKAVGVVRLSPSLHHRSSNPKL
ncbi:putative methyltransferase NSUN7 [Aulostomus maculatus]